MKVVFFGTSAFAAEILGYLKQFPDHEVIAVVTRPDRPRGRDLKLSGSPVKEKAFAVYKEIPLFQPEKASEENFCKILESLRPDVFLVVAYGEILKQNILSIPSKACINIHASLLPKYRGAAPIQRCLMNGETTSGVTLMEMVLAMDAGDMLLQEKVVVESDMNAADLEEALLVAAKKGLAFLFSDFDGYYARKTVQNSDEVTFAAKIVPEDGVLRWDQSAFQIHNRIRGLSPAPGAYVKLVIGTQTKRLKILASRVVESEGEEKRFPGDLLIDRSSVKVVCGEGVLELLQVQLEGKKPMSVEDFLRGVSKYFSFES